MRALQIRGVRVLNGPELRPSIAEGFGFDPFERVVDSLQAQIKLSRPDATRAAKTA